MLLVARTDTIPVCASVATTSQPSHPAWPILPGHRRFQIALSAEQPRLQSASSWTVYVAWPAAFARTAKEMRPTLVGAEETLKPASGPLNQRFGAPRPSQIAPSSSSTICHAVIRAIRMLDTMQKEMSFSAPLYCVRTRSAASCGAESGPGGGSLMWQKPLYLPEPRKDSCSVEWNEPRLFHEYVGLCRIKSD